MSQIAAGTDYNTTTNKIVTADNLNQHVNNATLQEGAISLQPNITPPVTASDQILIRDASANTLNKATVATLLGGGVPITTTALQVNGNTNTTTAFVGASTEDGEGTGTLKVYGEFEHQGVSHTGIAAGNNEQRPAIAPDGSIRWNAEERWLEVYDALKDKWVRGGGSSPFEASGGSITYAPEATTTPATFSSNGTFITVTTPISHGIRRGQFVELVSEVAGYEKVVSMAQVIGTFTFKLKTRKTGLITVNNAVCTYRRAGNHKIHVFNSSGNLLTGENVGYVEVFILGGGGWCPVRPSTFNTTHVGGGGGGIVHLQDVELQPDTVYNVVVGAGGTFASQIGGQSSFAGLIAYGGRAGGQFSNHAQSVTTANGRSGGNNIGDNGINPVGPNGGWGFGAGSGRETSEEIQAILGSGSSLTNDLFTDVWSGTIGIGQSNRILNYTEMFGLGGAGHSTSAAWQDGRYGAFPNRPARANGGGGGAGREAGIWQNGGSGVVIIRYPYFLEI
jgi:hypothetical protein